MAKAFARGTVMFLVSFVIGIVSNITPIIPIEPVQAQVTKNTVRIYERTPATSRSYARVQVLHEHGWRLSEYTCLRQLWDKESHWNHKAKNPNSSAFGIPQMLGMTTKDPRKQINIGLRYIKSRYGTPCKAWGWWRSHHWY